MTLPIRMLQLIAVSGLGLGLTACAPKSANLQYETLTSDLTVGRATKELEYFPVQLDPSTLEWRVGDMVTHSETVDPKTVGGDIPRNWRMDVQSMNAVVSGGQDFADLPPHVRHVAMKMVDAHHADGLLITNYVASRITESDSVAYEVKLQARLLTLVSQ